MPQNMRELMAWETDLTVFVGQFTEGGVQLPEAARAYFDVPNAQLCMKVQKEILLACEPTETSVPAQVTDNRLLLPPAAVVKLGVSDGDFVALIERRNAFAFKRIPPAVLKKFENRPAGRGSPTVQIRPLVKAKARPKRPKRPKAKAVAPAPPRQSGAVPQVIAVEPLRNGNRVNLKKEVRAHLPAGASLAWDHGNETVLTCRDTGSSAEMRGVGLLLPDAVIAKLDLSPGDHVALIERRDGLAAKKLTVHVRDGKEARAYDQETPVAVRRILETNPAPETLLPELASRYGTTSLRYDVRKWLKGRETFHAWLCRATLGLNETDDRRLRQTLVEARHKSQREDGSWEAEPMATARCLRELCELGAGDDPDTHRGAEWLLARAESDANPGMFFLSDRLVARQAEILEKRKRSKSLGKLRFAGRTPSEARRVLAADDIIEASCGPRIMWPNALALEALLGLGYESHPRVQRALASLLHGYTYWCECNYQRRAGTHVWRDTPGKSELSAREQDCIQQYRFGGTSGPEQYLGTQRVPRVPKEAGDVFPVKMRNHIQPCEVVTTRALRHARDWRVRRAAAAHLWRLAGVQRGPDGRFPQGDYCPSQAHMLRVFSYYDHPVSRVAILRAVPWIIENQNRDGSWGENDRKDASTLAVIQALMRVSDLLPGLLAP